MREAPKQGGLRPALRKVHAAADAQWKIESARLAMELLVVADPAERAAAYAALVARLSATGDALLPDDDAKVRVSFRPLGWQPPPPPDEDHAAAMAAWRERDAAAQAAKLRKIQRDRIDKIGWIVTGIVTAVLAVLVAVTVMYG